MNASKSFIAIAAVIFAGSAVASEMPVANSVVSSVAVIAPAPAGYAVRNLNVPSLTVNKFDTAQRARSHAQAVEAVKNGRSTFQTQLDLMKN